MLCNSEGYKWKKFFFFFFKLTLHSFLYPLQFLALLYLMRSIFPYTLALQLPVHAALQKFGVARGRSHL